MLCCLGLFAGFFLGSSLGDPWTFLASIAGFGLGLIGDLKLMNHGRGDRGRSKSNCHSAGGLMNIKKTMHISHGDRGSFNGSYHTVGIRYMSGKKGGSHSGDSDSYFAVTTSTPLE